MCFILLLFVFYPVQASMSFRQWSNIFLADQDERQRCFFADQKQFPADHWSLIGRYFELCKVVTPIDLHIILTFDCWHCFLVVNIWVSHALAFAFGNDNTFLLSNAWVVLFFIYPTFYSLKTLLTLQPFSLRCHPPQWIIIAPLDHRHVFWIVYAWTWWRRVYEVPRIIDNGEPRASIASIGSLQCIY
jgi:hypothetical protein